MTTFMYGETEGLKLSTMVAYVMEITVRKSATHGEYRSFVQLFFLFGMTAIYSVNS